MIYGLPWEGIVGLAFGVLFLAVFVYGVTKSAREADEVDREIFEAERQVRRSSYFDQRADQLGSEAEAFLAGRPR